MRRLDSQWRLSIGGCLFLCVEAYCPGAMNWIGQYAIEVKSISVLLTLLRPAPLFQKPWISGRLAGPPLP
jgi:hypothetical protein